MIWSHNGADGRIQSIGSGAFLQVDHRFKFTEQWDDEESLTVSVSLISTSGPMLPVSENFGLGLSNGVENDVALKDWAVVNQNGVRSNHNAAFLNPNDDVMVDVHLGFEGVTDGASPRSGSTLVRFIVDGTELSSSSIILDGKVSFPWKTPVNTDSTDVEISLSALNGQNVVYEVEPSLEFGYDTVDPELLGMSVAPFDHIEGSAVTEIDFLIADRPVLPSHAESYLWRSWVDDVNLDGIMQSEEVLNSPLILPTDQTLVQSEYRLKIDTSSAYSGSHFRGWLDVADSAGNIMQSSGSFDEPLFHVQINTDGSPRLGSAPATWQSLDSDWFHPGESNVLMLPLWDLNGITDIESIELDLGGNQNEAILLKWNASTQQCTSFEIYLDIESCELIPSQSEDIFSSEGIFKVNFTLEWGFDPDVSLVRIPSVLVRDLQGQSNILQVPDLHWRFSGEMEVDSSSMSFSVRGEQTESIGAWVQPRDDVSVSGELIWHRSRTAVGQQIGLNLEIGGNEAEIQSVNGSFSDVITVPLAAGSYGLFTSLYNPPNGAIDRTPSGPAAWFIVDDQAPSVVGVVSPSNGLVITESGWGDVSVELLLKEEDRLLAQSLTLQWSIHAEGLGLSSPSIYTGNQSLSVIGGRDFGTEILCSTNLNLESVISQDKRAEALELRIWVTGTDMAGHPVSPTFNDVDAPLSVWALEQRVAMYSFSEPEMKPNKNIVSGDLVSLNVLISNTGLANGSAQIYVDLVESNGARTRIDARTIDVESGSNTLFAKDWIPDRAGTMWIEFQIANGPQIKTDTLYVEESQAGGIMGGISGVSPGLLIIIFVLSASLIGLVIYGLKVPPSPKGLDLVKANSPITHSEKRPTPLQDVDTNAPYGSQQKVETHQENPYQ
jgi:hypothetical protein